jgi:23S rRNA (adenine2503-C2)-methyltransferase
MNSVLMPLIAEDRTAKFRFQLKDKLEVETVLVPFEKRDCVCLSSQVGCAMGCTFCFTSQMGLHRHLTAEEICEQYLSVTEWAMAFTPNRLKPNIVFMGQGEPLHNFNELKKSILYLTNPKTINLGPRNITVSTAGFLPGLKRFHELGQVNLALSLHSPFDEQRSELIPINQRWPLKEVFSVIDQLKFRRRQFLNCEYLMIKDFNLSLDHAQKLAELFKGKAAILNLIPINPYPGSRWISPSIHEIQTFKSQLVALGLRVFLRTTKGEAIMAACGQLNSLHKAYQ